MIPDRIPNPVIYTVGDVIGSWYYSHTKLNTLFGENGAPGDPPEGNCVRKCQAWLKRVNDDPEINAIDLLGKVLVDFMSRDLHIDPRWKEGYDRIQKVLADNNLAFHPEGKIFSIQAQKRFCVALSFPGEHRDFVEEVASHLASHVGRERVLYDKFYEAEFARPDLDTYLPNLYRTASELIAVFLCADYAKKRWCKLEWRFIRQLICSSDASRIMFLSFDDIGAVPEIGILSGDGYVSIGKRTAQEIAEIILQRLKIDAEKPGVPMGQQVIPTKCEREPSPPSSSALGKWQEKLAFLQTEEAKIADAEQRFAIQQRIEEAKEKIRELGG
ncbi:MAG: hypothetical protein A2Z25_00530 [Planctomycetes bacterium RBG_16_55_9]|nr:MAG: hypothetical protein A2Z25_00530 [Planctomycetes bacterium RBG_16_55_9]